MANAAEKYEWQIVFRVTDCDCDLLEKRFIASVHVDLVANPIRFCRKRNCAAASSTLRTRSSGKFFSGA